MKSRFFHFTLYAIIVYLTCTTLNAITGTAAASENHNVMLRVVRVTTDWMPFASTSGWPQAVPLKESEILKYYEVAIWEETSSVHFYVFPNDYDAMYGTRSGVTDAQKIAYREQFLIKKYTDMPNVWTDADERSTFLKLAFMDIASYLVNQHPSSEHHLMYSGHGGPGGRLFAGLLYINDANEFLNSWTESLGKPLGVIDMGGPCNKGSFSDLDNFYEYARYYVASDLSNGGYTMDQWTFEKHKETEPEMQYHALFSANQSLEEVLIGRINLKRKSYEYSRNNMINNQVAQANYLYSCAAFRKFSANFKVFLSSTGVDYDIYDDLYQYMIDNNASPTLIQQFSDVFMHKADNRDFFEWSVISNGMTMPHKGLLDQLRNPFSSSEREYRLSLPAGISFIHVPLKVTAVEGAPKTLESVGDLYDALGGASTVSLLITHDPQTGRWVGYFDTGDKGTSADKLLTDDLGIIAVMTTPASVLLSGDALGTHGQSAITLHPGINLVGIPLNDSRISRVSDLLELEGVKGNVTLTIVSDNGEFKLTESVGDSGDIPVTGGQSFILVVQEAATVDISGTGWSTPPAQPAAAPMVRPGRAVTDITPVLAVNGSIPPPVGGASLPIVGGASLPRFGVSDFAVTVKNLSTGIVDTALTNSKGASYRFTFVDIETGRTAQVGDILEITAHSADPLIGVHPVRHTVTAEDVKRSHIQLAELVAYEIPAKTELLVNYPNPFNPETWIPYRLAVDAFVTVTIYDQRGRVVRDIMVGHRIAGVYESQSKAIYWDGRTEFGERVASGLYFYTLTAGDYSATRKMVILK